MLESSKHWDIISNNIIKSYSIDGKLTYIYNLRDMKDNIHICPAPLRYSNDHKFTTFDYKI